MGGGVDGPAGRPQTNYDSGATQGTHQAAQKKVAEAPHAHTAPVTEKQVDSFEKAAATGDHYALADKFPAYAKAAGDDGIVKLVKAEVQAMVPNKETVKTHEGKQKLALDLLAHDRGPRFNEHATQSIHDNLDVSAKELYDSLPANKKGEFVEKFGAYLINDSDQTGILREAHSDNVPPRALQGLFAYQGANKRVLNEMADTMMANGYSRKEVLEAAGPYSGQPIADQQFKNLATDPNRSADYEKAKHALNEGAAKGLNAADMRLYIMGGEPTPAIAQFLMEGKDSTTVDSYRQAAHDLEAMRHRLNP